MYVRGVRSSSSDVSSARLGFQDMVEAFSVDSYFTDQTQP